VNPPQSGASADLPPFPGARPQVAGMHRLHDGESGAPGADGADGRHSQPLALEASPETWERGWLVRLPVRAEHVVVDKQLVVYERVEVGRRDVGDLQRIEATVRREELKVDVEGEVQPRVKLASEVGQPDA